MAFKQSQIIWAKNKTTYEKDIVAIVPSQAAEGSAEGGELIEVVYYTDDDRPEEVTETSFNNISLDCVMHESHTFRNEVTSYPVSNGFIVSEHVIKKNPMFSLNGLITNVSMPKELTLVSTIGKVVGAMASRVIGPVLGSLIGSAAHAIESGGVTNDRVKATFLELQELVREGTIVHVATILGNYEGCVIREVRIHQDVNTASVLPVVITFEQLIVIQPGGGIGYTLPEDQKQALRATTPTDEALLLNALKMSGVNILGALI